VRVLPRSLRARPIPPFTPAYPVSFTVGARTLPTRLADPPHSHPPISFRSQRVLPRSLRARLTFPLPHPPPPILCSCLRATPPLSRFTPAPLCPQTVYNTKGTRAHTHRELIRKCGCSHAPYALGRSPHSHLLIPFRSWVLARSLRAWPIPPIHTRPSRFFHSGCFHACLTFLLHRRR